MSISVFAVQMDDQPGRIKEPTMTEVRASRSRVVRVEPDPARSGGRAREPDRRTISREAS
jgi:hypothetical protein